MSVRPVHKTLQRDSSPLPTRSREDRPDETSARPQTGSEPLGASIRREGESRRRVPARTTLLSESVRKLFESLEH